VCTHLVQSCGACARVLCVVCYVLCPHVCIVCLCACVSTCVHVHVYMCTCMCVCPSWLLSWDADAFEGRVAVVSEGLAAGSLLWPDPGTSAATRLRQAVAYFSAVNVCVLGAPLHPVRRPRSPLCLFVGCALWGLPLPIVV
jgi:hypothetical protein